jgi:chemotaxis protein methyltransferase CheR
VRALCERYLTPADDGQVAISPLLRGRVQVEFQEHNLMDPGYPRGFDVVLCCNVLIYFEPGARTEVIGRLGASLREGGDLLLGPAEAVLPDLLDLTRRTP